MLILGLKLTVVGMSVVFIFLVLMVQCISLSSHLLKSVTEKEVKEIEENARQEALKRKQMSQSGSNDSKLVAVISAAIKMYRSKYSMS